MRTRSGSSAGTRREASAGLTAGALVLLAGYLLPWFQLREREWWVSGLRLLQDWDGAAWTVLPLLCFGGAVVAGLGTALVGGVRAVVRWP